MPRKPLAIDMDHAIELYQSGMSAAAVGKRFGLSASAMAKRLREAGAIRGRAESVKISQARKADAGRDKNTVIRMYKSGLSCNQISDDLGYPVRWVQKQIKDAGILRKGGELLKALYQSGGKVPAYIEGLPASEICARYIDGETIVSLSEHYGVSQKAIEYRLSEGGVSKRSKDEVYALIDRKKASAKAAKSRSRPVGFGETEVAAMLEDRGESPYLQLPAGTRNIDVAIHPIAVEIWISSSFPLNDTYCRNRIKDLSNAGWSVVYVLISRRTRIISDRVADQIIRIRDLTRQDPASARKHWVVRGSGDIATVCGDDLNDLAVIPSLVG